MKFLSKMKTTPRAYQLKCASMRMGERIREERVLLRKLPVLREREISQDMWLVFETIEIKEEFQLVEVTKDRGYTYQWKWYPLSWRPVTKDGSGSSSWYPYKAPRNWRISKMGTQEYLEKQGIA